jgi:uncharacterized membrane protein
MERWVTVTILVAILFGLYNVFTKAAAGRIPDVVGGFWLEGTALIGMGIYLLLVRQPIWGANVTRTGLLFALAAGACVALGTVLNFTVYRLEGPLSAAGPIILLGGVIIMAAAGALIFHESLTLSRSAGWVLAIVSIWLLSR